jgi:GTP:adenosylcobinamide-phosphate guanylyltransferase
MAVVELVRGLELFEQARTKFKSRTNFAGDVININTGTDLDHAQSIFD